MLHTVVCSSMSDLTVSDVLDASLGGLWSGVKIAMVCALLGAAGGGAYGWIGNADAPGLIERCTYTVIFGVVGICLANSAALGLIVLQIFTRISRAKPLLGVPVAGALGFLLGKGFGLLAQLGVFAYLATAPALIVGAALMLGAVILSALGFLASVLLTALLVAGS